MLHMPFGRDHSWIRHASGASRILRNAFWVAAWTIITLLFTATLDLRTIGHAAERDAAANAAPPGYTIVDGDILIRDRDLTDFIQGTYDVNLWTNGIVPYLFTTNDGTAVDSLTRTDISFVAGNPPEIRCVNCDFLDKYFSAGEEVLVSGSASNDNSAGNGYTITGVVATALTLSPGDPIINEAAGSTVTVISTRSVTPVNQGLMITAMTEWEGVANVDFVAWTSQTNYINIHNYTGNSSSLGMQGSQQFVRIKIWTPNNYTKHHELGHALGFYHEHSRPDRDSFVQVNLINVVGGSFNINFRRADLISVTADAYPIGTGVAVYDFDSVMHYGQCQASNCNNCSATPATCRTITVLPPNDIVWQNAIGQRTHLSTWDKRVMSFLYPENNWVFLHASSTAGSPNGGFVTPYTVWSTAYTAVPSNGRLIIIYPDTYSAAGTYSKAMTIEAPVGGVVLQ